MTQQPSAANPNDPAAGMAGMPGAAGGPSEEEVRAYLSQMRQAPVEQVLAELLQGLLNAAQVKLGRKDARLLLDAAGELAETARPGLSDDVAGQVDEALNQLRMAQVQAEKEVVMQGQREPNDLQPDGAANTGDDAATTGDADDQDATDAPEPEPGTPGSATSKLWLPGT